MNPLYLNYPVFKTLYKEENQCIYFCQQVPKKVNVNTLHNYYLNQQTEAIFSLRLMGSIQLFWMRCLYTRQKFNMLSVPFFYVVVINHENLTRGKRIFRQQENSLLLNLFFFFHFLNNTFFFVVHFESFYLSQHYIFQFHVICCFSFVLHKICEACSA